MPAVLGFTLVACGETPPPANPSSGELPLLVSTATAAPLPPSTAEPAPTAEASASPSASAAAKEPPVLSSLPGGCSRPPIVKSDEKEITDTFGSSPCGKLELGTGNDLAVLRIPENAFSTGVNVTFKIDTKAKGVGVQIGKIYHLSSIIPPSGTPEKVTSAGPPFVLQLPAGNKKDANLAIGEITPAKINWKVIAPVKIDDVAGIATYEITELGDLYIHVTTKAVTPPK